jgi:membrane protein
VFISASAILNNILAPVMGRSCESGFHHISRTMLRNPQQCGVNQTAAKLRDAASQLPIISSRRLRRVSRVLWTAANDWMRHGALDQAAAISFYTLFSLAPTLIIAVAVVGLLYGREEVRHRLADQADIVAGPQAAELVNTVLENAAKPGQGITATITGIIIMLIGASGAFGQLQEALDRVWEVQLKPGGGLIRFIRARAASFLMVLIVAFLLMATLVASASVSHYTGYVAEVVRSEAIIFRLSELAVLWVMVTILFALVFHFIPDVHLGWREILLGATITGTLFTLGTFVIGLYLGRTGAGSIYGAAGSLVAVLFWIYYSALIFLYGAEVTHVTARVMGRGRPRMKEDVEQRPPNPSEPA